MTEEELKEIAYARAAECKTNMYKSEKKMWKILQSNNRHFDLDWNTQVPVIIPWNLKEEFGSKAFYILDFVDEEKGIIIEVDGQQHMETERWVNDCIRDRVLEELGYTTYRISSKDMWDSDKVRRFLREVYDKEGIWYNLYFITDYD